MTSLVLASLCRQDGETTGQVKGGVPHEWRRSSKNEPEAKGYQRAFEIFCSKSGTIRTG